MDAQGTPTVTLTRADFVGVMKNAVAGLGLVPDAAMVTFPIELFLPGSDIRVWMTCTCGAVINRSADDD